jgi:hypothetical protein
MSSLRDASSAAQHPLSRLCFGDIAGDVTNPYAARLLQQRPVRTPGCPRSRLQSVQNAAARVIFNHRRTSHVSDVTDALNCRHWLQVSERNQRIRFEVAALVCRSLQRTSPQFRRTFTQTSAITARSNLRSVSRLQPVAPRCRLSSLHGRPRFSGFGRHCLERTSNGHHLSASNLSISRSRLKTFLFRHSFSGAVVQSLIRQ